MFKYILPLLVLLAACDSPEKAGRGGDKTPQNIVVSFRNEAEMDARMIEIDSMVAKTGLVANSLFYSKESGENLQVNGYMGGGADTSILRIEEVFNQDENGFSGRRMYYLNNGKAFVIHEKIDVSTPQKSQFVERISYYDPSGKVLKTKERSSNYEEEIEGVAFKPAALVTLSIDRVMRALNQEKEFQTTFQGFVDQGAQSYLIVGENKPDGYSSALMVSFKDKLINELGKDQQGYLGVPVIVNFEKYLDETGIEFQVYTGGDFGK